MTIASTEEEVIVPEIVRSSDEWAEIIKGDLGRAVEGIVSAGRNLIAAKEDVAHGEWLPMLREIGINERVARRVMSIGQNAAISNRTNWSDFPSALAALYELSRMDPDDVEDGIEHGHITPDMTIKDAKQYATGDTKPRMSVNDVVNMVMAGTEASPPPAAPMPRTESSREYDRAVGARKALRLGLMAVHQISLFADEAAMREALAMAGDADDVEATAFTAEAVAKARTFLNLIEEHI